MKISSALTRGLMITATLSGFAMVVWLALRHAQDVTQTKAPQTSPQKGNEAEAQEKKEAVAQWLAESRQKLKETTQALDKLKQQRKSLEAELSKAKNGVRPVAITPENSIEFSPVERARTTWNGHTDPDRVWHEQRQRAHDTLVRFDVPGSSSSR